jgi:hypothetical protein
VGAFRVHPHEHHANYAPQKDEERRVRLIGTKLDKLRAEYDAGREMALRTDYPGSAKAICDQRRPPDQKAIVGRISCTGGDSLPGNRPFFQAELGGGSVKNRSLDHR